MTNRRVVGCVLGLFLLSVLVRVPQLNRPLSYHHEFNPAMFLVTLEIWAEAGASSYSFAPVMSFDGEANKGIANPPIEHGITERDGEFYYLTFPAGAYLLPHIAFKALRVEPTPLALQVLNLIIHLLCALLVAGIVLAMLPDDIGPELERTRAAVVAGSLYLFAPALLWFQGNAYVFDALVLLFLLIVLAAAAPMLADPDRINLVSLAILACATVAGVLTEYVAALLALAVFLSALWNARTDLRYLWIAGATTVGVVAAVGLTLWQYSSLVGLDTYIEFLRLRFLERSQTPSSHGTIDAGLIQVIKWYAFGFLPTLLFLASLLFLARGDSKSHPLARTEKVVLLLGLAAVLMHHALLFGWTVRHDYSVIKAGIPLAILGGSLFARTRDRGRRWVVRVGVPLVLAVGALQFQFINRPGPVNISGLRYDHMETIGRTIAEHARPDDLVFLSGHAPMPQILYYSGRNIQVVERKDEALAWLRARGISNGLYVGVVGGEIREVERIPED